MKKNISLKNKNIRYTLLLLSLIFLSVSLFFVKQIAQSRAKNNMGSVAEVARTSIQNGTWIHPAKPLPIFSLKKTTGGVFTPLDFKGHWTLVFFGFSHCPEICPTTLSQMTQVARLIHSPNLQTLFISVDPERDTLPHLQEYVAKFDPNLLGATGENNELSKLSQSLGTLFFKVIPNPKEPENYFMDHGTAIALINPQGQWEASFTAPHHPEKIAADLRIILSQTS